MTDEGMADLIHQILEAVGHEGMDQAEIEGVVDWIVQARTDRAILGLFECGEVELRWRDGELFVRRRRPAKVLAVDGGD